MQRLSLGSASQKEVEQWSQQQPEKSPYDTTVVGPWMNRCGCPAPPHSTSPLHLPTLPFVPSSSSPAQCSQRGFFGGLASWPLVHHNRHTEALLRQNQAGALNVTKA
jgi:hypothetical protein